MPALLFCGTAAVHLPGFFDSFLVFVLQPATFGRVENKNVGEGREGKTWEKAVK